MLSFNCWSRQEKRFWWKILMKSTIPRILSIDVWEGNGFMEKLCNYRRLSFISGWLNRGWYYHIITSWIFRHNNAHKLALAVECIIISQAGQIDPMWCLFDEVKTVGAAFYQCYFHRRISGTSIRWSGLCNLQSAAVGCDAWNGLWLPSPWYPN